MSVGTFSRNDRQTGRRHRQTAASEQAPTLPDEPRGERSQERARLERVAGPDGILQTYARDLATIRDRAAELRVKNRKMLEQVRALQTKPKSSRRSGQR